MFQFQTKDTDTHAYVDLWHSEDGEKPEKQQTFKPVSFIIHFILVNKPIHHYNFSLLVSYSGG